VRPLLAGLALSPSCQQPALVVIETAGTYREDFLEEIVTEAGEQRVLFASGSRVYDQEFEMARVRLAHLPESRKAGVGSANALSVFGMPTGTY
jgi:predicted TIM-barrel fold metal-dependent hydrolase